MPARGVPPTVVLMVILPMGMTPACPQPTANEGPLQGKKMLLVEKTVSELLFGPSLLT